MKPILDTSSLFTIKDLRHMGSVGGLASGAVLGIAHIDLAVEVERIKQNNNIAFSNIIVDIKMTVLGKGGAGWT